MLLQVVSLRGFENWRRASPGDLQTASVEAQEIKMKRYCISYEKKITFTAANERYLVKEIESI